LSLTIVYAVWYDGKVKATHAAPSAGVLILALGAQTISCEFKGKKVQETAKQKKSAGRGKLKFLKVGLTGCTRAQHNNDVKI